MLFDAVYTLGACIFLLEAYICVCILLICLGGLEVDNTLFTTFGYSHITSMA